jgi:ketosteroid isomerase-like protein
VKLARARQFIEAVAAHDFDAAEELLDPDVETVTPRDTFHGVAACRQVLQKASGDERFTMEQSEPDFEDVDGDVLARTREIARWRETGELAYEREVAVRLTLDDERIVKVVVMPGGAPPSQAA